MKFKFSAVIAAALAASMLMTACSSGDDESSSDSRSKSETSSSSEAEPTTFVEASMVADENAVPASGAAPILSASKAEGKPGETVEVTISVSGADQQWSMCGVHVTYDERLSCITNGDPKKPEYAKGAAVNEIEAFTSMLQTGEDRNEYLIENKMNSVFFAAVASADLGRDGEIVTYKFTIPEDAAAGTEYKIGFYYREGDMFLDTASDAALQDYAFSHWQEGSITVA
ncbi:MAG: hypothetical protein IJX77_07295 [Ruminococcus sp.]|nr:hypothetical protein [Ruminococcus sp.]